MALPATTVWEVRTDGDDTNGGGFNASRSGATKTADDNYTYGASYGAISYTDLYSDGASLNKLKSDTRAFVTADIGHIIQLGAGTNRTATLFFEITAVASGVATLDANAWSAANSAKDGVGKLGGALATVAGTYTGLGSQSNMRTVYIKAGAGYTLSSSNFFLLRSMTRYIGYSTTRGDHGRVTFTETDNSTSMMWDNKAETNRVALSNIVFDGGGCSSVKGMYLQSGNSSNVAFTNCKFHRLDNLCSYVTSNVAGLFSRCEITDGTSTPIQQSGLEFFNCDISGSATYHSSASSIMATNCIFRGAGSHGIYSNSNSSIRLYNCVCYGNGGDGVRTSQDWPTVLVNTIFAKNGGYGYYIGYNPDKRWAYIANCASYNNTSGNYDPSTNEELTVGCLSLTADPGDTNCENLFVDAANGDFRLTRTAGYGAACRAAGVGPVGQTSYPDIGAVQHGDTTVPAVGDVEYGVMFGDDNALMGTLQLPDLAQKRRIRSID